MAREFKIRVTQVDLMLTHLVESTLAMCYGGFDRTEGVGGYTRLDGKYDTAPSFTWSVSTSDDRIALANTVSDIARMYCRHGKQESILYIDTQGEAFFVYATGEHVPVVSPS